MRTIFDPWTTMATLFSVPPLPSMTVRALITVVCAASGAANATSAASASVARRDAACMRGLLARKRPACKPPGAVSGLCGTDGAAVERLVLGVVLPRLLAERPREDDAEEIQPDHRRGHRRLREHVAGRRDHRGDM